MNRTIYLWPSSMLHEQSETVVDFGPSLLSLVDDLLDTMYYAQGVGLSAIQIGIPLRVFVIDVGSGPEVYINPLWTTLKNVRPIKMGEGCLSIPGIVEQVLRYPRIKVSYMTRTGELVQGQDTDTYSGNEVVRMLRAQAIQHECSHLDGKMFISELPAFTREKIIKALRGKR